MAARLKQLQERAKDENWNKYAHPALAVLQGQGHLASGLGADKSKSSLRGSRGPPWATTTLQHMGALHGTHALAEDRVRH